MEKNLLNEIAAIKERNRIYEEILNKVLEGILIIDPEEIVVWFNDMVERIDGVKLVDAIGRKSSEAWDRFFFPNFMSYTIRTGDQTEEQLHTYTNKETGEKRALFCQAFPFYSNDQLRYIYSLGWDMDFSEKRLNKISEYRRRILNDNARIINNTVYTLYDVIGSSPVMREIVKQARQLATNMTPVMLCGETGTGKEVFAQGIHNASPQNKGKFVAINCAAIPDTLIETILFGSSKGAFTGAVDKQGLLEEAHDGTLFLDELNSMPLVLQGKFLRVFQEKQARRLGGSKPYPVNCRVISATNRDPRELVRDGTLRSDLFFRLAVLTLDLPPLAERGDDIVELTHFLIEKYNREYNLTVRAINDGVISLFRRYRWPGNVRELDNVIEYAMNFIPFGREELMMSDLPKYLRTHVPARPAPPAPPEEDNVATLEDILRAAEEKAVAGALTRSGWNITHAAKELGIHREAIYYRIKKFGLKKECLLPKSPPVSEIIHEIGPSHEPDSRMQNTDKFTELNSDSGTGFFEDNVLTSGIPFNGAAAKEEPGCSEASGEACSGGASGEVVQEVKLDEVKLRALLDYCSEPKTRKELQKFCCIRSEDYFRNKILKPLLQQRLLKRTIPNKPNSPKQKYVK